MHGHQPARAQPRQVVGHRVLRLVGQRGQLMDPQVTARQLAEQPPAHRMTRQLQERRRLDLRVHWQRSHPPETTSS